MLTGFTCFENLTQSSFIVKSGFSNTHSLIFSRPFSSIKKRCPPPWGRGSKEPVSLTRRHQSFIVVKPTSKNRAVSSWLQSLSSRACITRCLKSVESGIPFFILTLDQNYRSQSSGYRYIVLDSLEIRIVVFCEKESSYHFFFFSRESLDLSPILYS